MRRLTVLSLAMMGAGGVAAAPASAASVGFDFAVLYASGQATPLGVTNTGTGAPFTVVNNAISSNTPFVYLKNTGTVGITGFSLTLLSSSAPSVPYVFDFVQRDATYGGGFTATNTSPGAPQNNGTPPLAPYSNVVSYTFAGGFDGGEKFSFQTDVDPGTLTDPQLRAALAGATVTVTFADGKSLSESFGAAASLPTSGAYLLSAEAAAGGPAAVPVPASAWGGMGLLGLAGAGRELRRRRAVVVG